MLGRLIERAAVSGQALAAVARSGLLSPVTPDRLARMGRELERRGPFGAVGAAAAIRWGDRDALVDELGTLSFAQIEARSNALARAWARDGLEAGDGVAILCRNHRGFLDAAFAAAKLGARTVYMNTEFAGPQIAGVWEREGVGTIVADAEYDERIPGRLDRHFRAWSEGGTAAGADATLEELIAAEDGDSLPAPSERPTFVLLTSGTTGMPKGAPRQEAGSLVNLGALLQRVPFRTGGSSWIAPPFFHALGFGQLALGMALGTTAHTRRRFDAAEMLAGVSEARCRVVVVVPAMLQRVLALDSERIAAHDTGALEVIFCSGSQLPGPVATRALETFGDVLYVLYGSTEVAYASIATPEDLRAAPSTVGRPCLGTTVRLLGPDGRQVGSGRSGRIFVSNGAEFDGYTDGQRKEVIDGVMSSGDIGHFDRDGRLYVDGRDDEMIVSGGENVFPQELEELLMARDDVADVAVTGVEDTDFGQRLAAWVVAAPGTEPAAEELRRHVGSHLARYKVPRDVHLVTDLPRNATGKILKRQLRPPS